MKNTVGQQQQQQQSGRNKHMNPDDDSRQEDESNQAGPGRSTGRSCVVLQIQSFFKRLPSGFKKLVKMTFTHTSEMGMRYKEEDPKEKDKKGRKAGKLMKNEKVKVREKSSLRGWFVNFRKKLSELLSSCKEEDPKGKATNETKTERQKECCHSAEKCLKKSFRGRLLKISIAVAVLIEGVGARETNGRPYPCYGVQCLIGCERPQRIGSMIPTDNCPVYPLGAKVWYRCADDYYQGMAPSWCRSYRWTAPKLTCRLIDCDHPPTYDGFTTSATGTTHRSMATFKCDGEVVGTKSVTCEKSGEWLPKDKPICHYPVDCGEPGHRYGMRLEASNGTQYGSNATIWCGGTEKGVATCLENGEWQYRNATCQSTDTVTSGIDTENPSDFRHPRRSLYKSNGIKMDIDPVLLITTLLMTILTNAQYKYDDNLLIIQMRSKFQMIFRTS